MDFPQVKENLWDVKSKILAVSKTWGLAWIQLKRFASLGQQVADAALLDAGLCEPQFLSPDVGHRVRGSPCISSNACKQGLAWWRGSTNGECSHLLARLGVCRAVHIPADECIDRGVNNGCQIYCCSKNKPFVKARLTQGCQQLEATPPWHVTWLYLTDQAGWDGSSTGIQSIRKCFLQRVLRSQQPVRKIFLYTTLSGRGKQQPK